MSYLSVNPYDGKTLKTFAELSDGQLETALQTAATDSESWRRTTFAGRAVATAKAGGTNAVTPAKWIQAALMALALLAASLVVTGCNRSDDSDQRDSDHHMNHGNHGNQNHPGGGNN